MAPRTQPAAPHSPRQGGRVMRMHTRPDRTIYTSTGNVYLERWHVLRTRWLSIYLHKIHRNDERALHDHPGNNVSILLRGSYAETTFTGCRVYRAGAVIYRPAHKAHRLTIVRPVWSLFLMGPVIRQWGFYCTRGWTSAKDRTLCGDETL